MCTYNYEPVSKDAQEYGAVKSKVSVMTYVCDFISKNLSAVYSSVFELNNMHTLTRREGN